MLIFLHRDNVNKKVFEKLYLKNGLIFCYKTLQILSNNKHLLYKKIPEFSIKLKISIHYDLWP